MYIDDPVLIFVAFVAGILSAATTLLCIANYRIRKQTKETKGVPYYLRNGLEDMSVMNIRGVDELRRMAEYARAMMRGIDATLEEMGIQMDLVEQIRNGTYKKNQPASKRRAGSDGKQ